MSPPVLRRRTLLQALLASAAGAATRAAAEERLAPIDFSYAGYGAGAVAPRPAAVLSLAPSGGDDTWAINAALAEVGVRTPRGADGWRGAVRLEPGRFRVDGQIRMGRGGVVLRGGGAGVTTIVAAGQDRRTLIRLGGEAAAAHGAPVAVAGPAPAGTLSLRLAQAGRFAVGDRVLVRRPSTAAWIHDLGMDAATGDFAADRLHWKPGTRDLVWDRTVVAVRGEEIGLDAPITYPLEPRYGGGAVSAVDAPVARLGLEDLTLESAFDASRPGDEEHSWIAVALDHVEDAFVRDLEVRGFVSSAVQVGARARRVSVERVRSRSPVSEVGGWRRRSFVVEGQQALVADCLAEQGLNDFSAGLLAGGPNVFLRCRAERALGASGGFESLSTGALFDQVRVEGAGLVLAREPARAQAAGWTAANSLLWKVQAAEVRAEGPPGAPVAVRQGRGSLYEAQLRARTGSVRRAPPPRRRERPPAYSPPPEPPPATVEAPGLRIVNGRFVVGDRTLWGGALNHAWWRGQATPAAALDHGRSWSRWVPGREGRGLTEDLEQMADDMAAAGTPFHQSGPGLWYDRRRDDHSLAQRTTADVWAPFYETPWARSGVGKAFDGLSKYDLARYNPWYFARLKRFTELCGQRGLVHVHNLYNTHNVLETAAHWTDYPWRPFNNLNDTGLPEPPPLDAGATVHLADRFYSTAHPPLAALHRAYIAQVLATVGGAPNLILGLAFQFSGPLAFQQFFLDEVRAFEQRRGRRVPIALTTAKDVTDAILADPVRGPQVAVIDMRYWQHRPDGGLWAPPGGRNLAFREMIAADFGRSGDSPPDTTPEQAYRQAAEYRTRYPDKAVVAWHNGVTAMPALMAGAAQVLNRNPSAGHGQGRSVDRTPVDAWVQEQLADRLAQMVPANGLAGGDWVLADPERRTLLVYSLRGAEVRLATDTAGYRAEWFEPRQGRRAAATGAGGLFRKPDAGWWALLLRR